MKYVSFSLFGNAPKYCVGAIRNAELMRTIYPGWVMVLHYGPDVPEETLSRLSSLGVVLIPGNPSICPTMWRFLVIDFQGCERFISRDCDSRINPREAWAAQEWERSGRPALVLRDHPNHAIWPVMAGMFGLVRGYIPIPMKELISHYRQPAQWYGTDQDFLRDVLWGQMRQHAIIFDSETHLKNYAVPFPPRENQRFVGEVFDEHDNPRDGDWQMLADLPKGEKQ